jgi:hypothetical protein
MTSLNDRKGPVRGTGLDWASKDSYSGCDGGVVELMHLSNWRARSQSGKAWQPELRRFVPNSTPTITVIPDSHLSTQSYRISPLLFELFSFRLSAQHSTTCPPVQASVSSPKLPANPPSALLSGRKTPSAAITQRPPSRLSRSLLRPSRTSSRGYGLVRSALRPCISGGQDLSQSTRVAIAKNHALQL